METLIVLGVGTIIVFWIGPVMDEIDRLIGKYGKVNREEGKDQ